MMPGSWFAYLLMSFLALKVNGIGLSLVLDRLKLLVPLRQHEDRNIIFLIHGCIPNAQSGVLYFDRHQINIFFWSYFIKKCLFDYLSYLTFLNSILTFYSCRLYTILNGSFVHVSSVLLLQLTGFPSPTTQWYSLMDYIYYKGTLFT